MILSRYLSRQMALKMFWVLLAFTSLMQLIDLLGASTDIIERGEGLFGFLKYIVLRMPVTMQHLVPISTLLGAALTFYALAQNSEMIALRGSGQTPYRAVFMLVPLTLFIGVAYFFLSDQIVPRADKAFVSWWERTEPETNATQTDSAKADDEIWARTSFSVIRIRAHSQGGRSLTGVTIYSLDQNQQLSERIQASSAQWQGNGTWELNNVGRYIGNDGESSTFSMSAMSWHTALSPATVLELANPEVNISTSGSRKVITGNAAGSRSGDYYRLQLQKAYLTLFSPLIMLLLAAPVAAGLRRSGTATRYLGFAIVAGFGFLLMDGILLSLGQAHIVPMYAAAWSTAILFAAGGSWVLLRLEN
jgi:lipopolysaccharide export system permease protein